MQSLQKDNQLALLEIIIRLYNFQPIQKMRIKSIQFTEQPESSCYFGLLGILYNLVHEGKKNAQQNTDQSIKYHKILHYRGQILSQLVKASQIFLPNPAYYLANFDFNNFNNFCIEKGLDYLFRHSRGIYPLIDTGKTPPLQFLPFYNECIQSPPMLVGNENWMASKKALQTFYDKQVKTQKLFRGQSTKSQLKIDVPQINSENGNEEIKSKNGIWLCYILLGCKKEELSLYIQNLNNYYETNKDKVDISGVKQRLRKFALWSQNYFKLIQDGLKLYQKQVETLPQLFYGLTAGSIEETLINLIEQVFWLNENQHEDQKQVKMEEIRKNFNKLVAQSELVHEFRSLFLCFLHVIEKQLQFNPEIIQIKQAYCKTNYFDPVEQPYNRIMFTDEEIIQMYKQGRKTQFPSKFEFSKDLLQKIIKEMCRKDENNIARNLQQLKFIENKNQRLNLLISSKKLEQFSQDNLDNDGEKIINYIQDNLDQLSSQSFFGQNNLEYSKEALKQFIAQWRMFYACMKSFSFQNIDKILTTFSQIKKKQSLKMQNSFSVASKRELKYPLKSLNIVEKILKRFIKEGENQSQRYLNMIEQSNRRLNTNTSQISQIKALTNLISVCKDQRFKQIIAKQQENVQLTNQIWKIYSKMVLLVPQQSSLLIKKIQILPQLPVTSNHHNLQPGEVEEVEEEFDDEEIVDEEDYDNDEDVEDDEDGEMIDEESQQNISK